jgi:uncharacterized membrane protein
MGRGVWTDWYGSNVAGLTAFTITYTLAALGSAINDTISALYAIIIAGAKGKLVDFFRCIKTRPGAVMVVCALVGGPIASTAYVVSLQMAGSIIIPITALCPAIGAILGRILFKQKLNVRMLTGITICFAASIVLGGSTLSGVNLRPQVLVGCAIALIAALGWGIEGCIAGFGTTLIDYEIGITIRQSVSGLTNLIVLVPILGLMAGDIGLAPRLIGEAITDWQSLTFFFISGFFSLFAYSLWYKGNSMCGAPLGMACNGAYSFWGPFFCWIVLGAILKQDGWALAPLQWMMAVVMFLGICLIAFNPLEIVRRGHNEAA